MNRRQAAWCSAEIGSGGSEYKEGLRSFWGKGEEGK